MEEFPTALDPVHPDVRVEFGLAEAEHARLVINRATAEQFVAIHAVLSEARAFPELFIGHKPFPGRDDVEFAVRAAVLDLATRLHVSENTILSYEQQAATLMVRTPRSWALFREGEMSPANAKVIAQLATTLPDADTARVFDEHVADLACRLAPARFKARARSLKERVHSESSTERHQAAREERRVVIEPADDGMAWLSAFLPADVAAKIDATLETQARALACAEGETRTLPQIRADLFGDTLTGEGTPGKVGVRVGVMIPVMTLLGLSEEPACLDGYGPIDPATARKLAAQAPSFYRMLTHPITGTILDLDRITEHIPADMRRWLQTRDQTCSTPGCGKPAVYCDLDHITDRQFGGTTRVTNLVHLCRKHHREKHKTLWKVTQKPDGTTQWTSPTGNTTDADPPPF